MKNKFEAAQLGFGILVDFIISGFKDTDFRLEVQKDLEGLIKNVNKNPIESIGDAMESIHKIFVETDHPQEVVNGLILGLFAGVGIGKTIADADLVFDAEKLAMIVNKES